MGEFLVAGATGQVGRHVRSTLIEAGLDVRGDLDDVECAFLDCVACSASVIERIARRARRIVCLCSTAPSEPLISHPGLSWTFLRPTSLAGETLAWAEQIREGVVRLPYGQAKRAPIHERDVAAVAVHVLTSAGHGGATYALSGPELLTREEQARIIGEVVGREVRWADRTSGIAPEQVTGTVERLLGRAPLTFRRWAEDHADSFR